MTKTQKFLTAGGIIIAGIVVGLLFRAGQAPAPVSTETPKITLPTVELGTPADLLGGVYSNVANYFPNIYVPGESQIGDSIQKTLAGTIGPGVTVSSWQNTTGSTVYVSEGIGGFTSGTASSSLRLALFATTTAPSTITSIDNFTSLTNVSMKENFLFNALYATSTTASTTNSLIALKANQDRKSVV